MDTVAPYGARWNRETGCQREEARWKRARERENEKAAEDQKKKSTAHAELWKERDSGEQVKKRWNNRERGKRERERERRKKGGEEETRAVKMNRQAEFFMTRRQRRSKWGSAIGGVRLIQGRHFVTMDERGYAYLIG